MENKIKRLEDKIREHAQHYYSGSPIISDEDFDGLCNNLRDIDPDNSVLTLSGYGYSVDHLDTKPHCSLIGSLDKVSSGDLDKHDWKYSNHIISSKLDGNSGVAYYDTSGKLMHILSRGDGNNGIDVTNNLLPGKSVPINVTPGILAVRGEIMMSWESFDTFKDAAHPRNTASGLSQSKYANTNDLKHLVFIAYSIVNSSMPLTVISYYDDMLEILSDNDFMVVRHNTIQSMEDYETVKELYDTTSSHSGYQISLTKNQYQKFPIDGAVICSSRFTTIPQDDNSYSYEFDALAVKYPDTVVSVNVKDVEWQLSGHGRLIPVIVIEPTILDGCTIERCSGFNAASIKEQGIANGSVIQIKRANGVIPHWTSTLSSHIPNCIPEYYNNIKTHMEGCHLMIDIDKIPNAIKDILYHASEAIDGLGGSKVDALIDVFKMDTIKYLVDACTLANNPTSEFYSNYVELLVKAAGSKDAVAYGLMDKLMKSVLTREITLATVLQYSYTKGLGESSATVISKYIEPYALMRHLELVGELPDDILNKMPTYVPGKSIKEDPSVIIELLKIPFNFVEPTDEKSAKYTIALTGSLSKPRGKLLKEWKDFGVIEGGNLIDYLVCNGTSSSSKYKHAINNNIQIVTEDEFLNIVRGV